MFQSLFNGLELATEKDINNIDNNEHETKNYIENLNKRRGDIVCNLFSDHYCGLPINLEKEQNL